MIKIILQVILPISDYNLTRPFVSSLMLSQFLSIQDVKKEYNMSETDFHEFKQKVREDEEDQERKGEKFEKKLERRAQKKELKKNVQDSCKTQ